MTLHFLLCVLLHYAVSVTILEFYFLGEALCTVNWHFVWDDPKIKASLFKI